MPKTFECAAGSKEVMALNLATSAPADLRASEKSAAAIFASPAHLVMLDADTSCLFRIPAALLIVEMASDMRSELAWMAPAIARSLAAELAWVSPSLLLSSDSS